MKKKIYVVLMMMLIVFSSAIVNTNTDETVKMVPYGVRDATGNPVNVGEGNCSGCHAGTVNSNGSLNIVVKDAKGAPVSAYDFNQLYTIDVTVSKANISTFGFDAEVVTSHNTDAGVITPLDTSQVQTLKGERSTNMTHVKPGKTVNSHTFSFIWRTPLADSGIVTIYAAGLAANGNVKNTGDFTYTSVKKLSAIGSTTIAEAEKNINSISIYPNPVSNMLHLRYNLKKAEIVTISLYSLNGQKMMDLLTAEHGAASQDDVIYIPPAVKTGLYLLQLNTSDCKRIEKIIVNRTE